MANVTQINGRRAKEHIVVNGVDWHLKKDATDPSTIFPFERMNWLNAGCDKVGDNVYCCWILGVIPPTYGTLEKPVSVFTLGFNGTYIPMTPSSLTKQDMLRMHFYTSEYSELARGFINSFLDRETQESATKPRTAMMPFPDLGVSPNDGCNDGNPSMQGTL